MEKYEVSCIQVRTFLAEQMIKPGLYIYPMCNIEKGVQADDGTLLNSSVFVSHDTTINKANYIGPGVVISGNVTIGNATFIESDSVISNGVHMGDNVVIGVGRVIPKDVPSNSFVIENPMSFENNIMLI
jgi:acetyltransferase-like isoleucine patch superfamily enzyme